MQLKIIFLFSMLTISLNTKAQNFQQVTVAEAKQIIADNSSNPAFTILDVRTPEEYNTGHIEGAFMRNFYDDDFEQQLDSLNKNRTYLVYCQAGYRSGLSYEMLQELGFTTVYDMLGGMNAWNADNCPTTTQIPDYIDLTAPLANTCENGGTYSIQIKIGLEGAFNGTTMSNTLATQNLIPTAQPYNTQPWFYNGNETATITNQTVDWAVVCLRNNPETTLACQAVLIQTNGNLVNTDGDNCLAFQQVAAFSSYYVSVHHRGHISVISSEKIAKDTNYDFTQNQNAAAGIEPLKNIDNQWLMYGGDYDNNNIINNVDFNLWTQDGASVNQYTVVDADGNGIVNNLDFNIWERNRSKVGLTTLSNNLE